MNKKKLLLGSAAVALALNSAVPYKGMATPKADMSDPVALFSQINKAFEEFKAENDAKIEAGIKGDVIRDEKIEKINAAISDLTDAYNKAIEAQERALQQSPNGKIDVAQAAIDFSMHQGLETPISVDDYRNYEDGFNAYLRTKRITAGMEVGLDPSGGYLVTPDTSGRIVEKVRETSPMRQYADIETIGTDMLQGFNDLEEGTSGWVGEKQARPETDTPGLGQWSIPVHEMYANPHITQKLLDDASFDVTKWLEKKTSDKFMRQENTAFINGNAILKPKGLLTYDTALTADSSRDWGTFQHIISGSVSTVNDTVYLINLMYELKNHFRANANWFMNRKTIAVIRALKDGDNNYIWQPDFTRKDAGALLGYGIAEFEDMPDIASNSLSIAFGDMKETYTIVDRIGIRVIRDHLTAKPRVGFYTTKRVGGGALNFESMKFMKFTT